LVLGAVVLATFALSEILAALPAATVALAALVLVTILPIAIPVLCHLVAPSL
jgi:hypothetical protein